MRVHVLSKVLIQISAGHQDVGDRTGDALVAVPP